MAGSQSADDNPVGINVTPMVDVIFCLCLFFMCSLHFKQLEGKIDSWLPKNRGNRSQPVRPVLEDVRVFLRWDSAASRTIRRVGNRPPAADDQDLTEVMRQMAGDHRKAGAAEVPVVIDATSDVPWKDVVHVMDLCVGENLGQIELTQPFEERSGHGE